MKEHAPSHDAPIIRGDGRQDHKYRRGTVKAEGSFGGAFRCKNDQHVADGDDGFNKQDEANPAGRAPHHECQYSQPRYDVSHPLEAKPPGDVGAAFRKRQAEDVCRG